jgi:hypothetical protein
LVKAGFFEAALTGNSGMFLVDTFDFIEAPRRQGPML